MSANLARVVRILDEVRGVKSQYGITDWEWQFLMNMQSVAGRGFSEKQEKVLAKIERKVFEEADSE